MTTNIAYCKSLARNISLFLAGVLLLDGAALSPEEVAQLKAQIAAQQRQIDELTRSLQSQQALLDAAVAPGPVNAGRLTSPEAVKPAPLYFNIGSARFTPFGFVDLTQVVRSTNAGGGIGTGFSGIPFNNTVAGKLSESRFSLQNSRVGLRVDSNYRGTDVTGYLETDFLGNAPTNLTVTSNAATMRLRLFWVQLKRSRWEMLAGQSWSLLTPGRKGISPIPGDLFYSQDVDTNYQNGLTWARQPTLRMVYHANKAVTWAIAAEASDQYIGGAVTLPAQLAGTAYPAEFNNGTAGTATPNLHPDFISKLAFDGSPGGRAMHAEVSGLLRTFRSYNPLTDSHDTRVGGGGQASVNLELIKGLRVIGNGFVSSGGGRYLFGSGPDLIARPNGAISLVHAASTVDGLEYSFKPKGDQTGKETLFYTYYGGAYFGKNTGVDTSGKAPVLYGYGYPGSPLGANRAINEYSFGVHQTFWKSPNYGDIRLLTQYSYLMRDPWSVPAANTQRNAYTHMLYLNLRYDLP